MNQDHGVSANDPARAGRGADFARGRRLAMSLRKKSLLLTGVVLLGLLPCIHLASSTALREDLRRLERGFVQQQLATVESAVQAEVAGLATAADQCADRPGMRQLAAASSPDADRLAARAGLLAVAADFVVVHGHGGQVAWARQLDRNGPATRAPEALLRALGSVVGSSGRDVPPPRLDGFVRVDQQVVVVATRPLTDGRVGRVGGWLSLARLLDDARLRALLHTTQLDLAVTVEAATGPLPEGEEYEVSGRRFVVDMNDEDVIVARAQLPGIDRSAVGALVIRAARPLRAQVGEYERSILVATLSSALLFGGLQLWWLGCLVVSRIRRIRGHVVGAAAGSPSASRSSRWASDEIARLDRAVVSLTESLEAQKAAAIQADRDQSSFLANMSGKIRTPMTVILGYSEILMQRAHGAVDWDTGIDAIRRNGEQMLGVLNDILELSKLAAGKVRPERLAVDVEALVREAAERPRALALARGLDFAMSVAADVPRRISSDPAILRRILGTLLENAVRCTPRGTVRIDVSCRDGDDGTRMLCCSVFDTGNGIPSGCHDEIFEPFERRDEFDGRVGRGLGLPIAKRLAHALGGDLQFESRLGRGSVFTVTAPIRVPGDGEPAASEPESFADRPESGTSPGLRGVAVLLVEDGADNQRLIRAILEGQGADVTVAQHGREACDLVAARGGRSFDLILMDLQMPEFDGYQATAWLRAAGCATPIVALSAHSEAEQRGVVLAAGCDGFLGKPIRKRELVAAVTQFVRTPTARGGE
jgi:signal transduction histidine kinase/CheY-like chemotaxis protein